MWERRKLKARTFYYCQKFRVPPGWWPILHLHVKWAVSVDPTVQMYIIEYAGGLRVDTWGTTPAAHREFGKWDMEVWNQTSITCPCCGRKCREAATYSSHRSLCDSCLHLSEEERGEISYKVAKRFMR